MLMKTFQLSRIVLLLLCASGTVRLAWAGPPFITDDPEPVPLHHWEIYLASQTAHDAGGWSGTSPHVEVNYGALPDLQLHLIAPIAYSAPAHENSHVGLGDVELGAKYRFFEETDWRPQIGVFPLVELPTGDADRNLGAGQTQLFLPVWLQKSAGKWTTYGGGGYWINPGADNRNWWFMGWLLQYQLRPDLAIGTEIFHETAQQVGGDSDTKLNIGVIFDFNENNHLIFSGGPVIQGPSGFQTYLAYQITFGPHAAADAGK
jgi:hypothetical protein